MTLLVVDHRSHELLHVGQISVDPVRLGTGDRPFEGDEPGVELWLQPVEQLPQWSTVSTAATYPGRPVECQARGVLHRLCPGRCRGLPVTAGRAIKFDEGVMKPADLAEKPLGELQRSLCLLQCSDSHVCAAPDDHQRHQRQQ
jgi:hypothetical protein